MSSIFTLYLSCVTESFRQTLISGCISFTKKNIAKLIIVRGATRRMFRRHAILLCFYKWASKMLISLKNVFVVICNYKCENIDFENVLLLKKRSLASIRIVYIGFVCYQLPQIICDCATGTLTCISG